MSFPSSTIKYYSSFESYDGNTYQWEIRERGFSGSAIPLTPSTRSHCSTRWVTSGDDEFGPIIGSETSLSFFDNSLGDVFNDLFGSDSSLHKKYALAITQSGTTLWIGLMEPVSSDVDEDGLTTISVSATCGLGRLENFDYTSNEDTGDPRTGRARLTTIIAELLSATEFGLDIYVACDMYPRKSSGSQLTADNNPLYNVYADRLAFSVGQDGSDQDRPVAANHYESLKALCERFGLVVFQAEGAWHVYAEELFYGTATPGPTKFYRWKYDSSGAESGGSEPSNREEFIHAITLTNETLTRQRATIGQLPQYNAVTVEYNHDVSQPLLNTDFSPTAESGRRMMGRTGTEYWVTSNAAVSRRVSNFQLEDEYEWRIDAVPFDWVGETAASINSSIGNFKASQTTLSTYKNGDQFQQQIEFYIDSATGRNTAFNQDTMVAMQIKLNSSPTPYYLKLDTSTSDESRQGEWVTTPDTWVIIKVGPTSLDSWTSIAFLTGALPDDGTITVTIGPVVESLIYTDDAGAVSNADYVLWDNVDLKFVRPDGTLNPVTTIVTNYLVGTEKDDYRGKLIQTVIGDGPQDDSRGSLTYSTDISDRTADWEKGPVGASASGDSIDDLLTRIVLRSTNRPRRTHNTTYETLSQRISPLRTIRRGGSNYRAKEIAYDWIDSVVSGSWYKTQQTGFTDNIEFGIKSGTGSGSLLRGSGSVAGTFAGGLSTSLLSEQAVRITRTSSVIPQGVYATNPQEINVDEIAEPLLKAGDKIVIIAPDLSFYRVEVASDQAAGATSISIVDPDSESDPKANFDFPRQVAYPANILFVEDKLLSIARSGEEGFAVTVLGQDLGLVNETKNGSYDILAVDEWSATIRAGSTVEIQQKDGSFVTVELTEDAFRGASSISFTLPGEEAATVALDVETGDRIAPSGSVGRADFTVTADAITSYISTDGDLIATITTDADSGFIASTDTDVTGILKPGDTVYFHGANNGRVFKRTVASVGSPTSNDFGITSAFGGDDILAVGDYVFGGTLVGMRIDADGVDFVNTHIKSDNYNGTIDSDGVITANGDTGWAITKSGEAEFANLTVRGTLSTLEGTIGVGDSGVFSRAVTGGEIKIDGDGLSLIYDRAAETSVPIATEITFDNENGSDTVALGFSASDTGGGVWLTDEWHIDSAVPIDISTTGGNYDISLTPHGTGQIILDYASFPASDGTSGQILSTNADGTLSWITTSAGVTAFTDLTDTPANYTGAASKFVKVNGAADALEFVADPGYLTGPFATLIGAASDASGTPSDKHLLYYDSGTPGWVSTSLADISADISGSNISNDEGWTSNAGTVTEVISGLGSGIDVSSATTTPTLSLNLNELGSGTIVSFSGVSAGGDSVNQSIGTINVGSFNNDAGYTTNTGTVTSVISGLGSGIDVTSATTTPTLVLNLDELSSGTIVSFAGVSSGGDSIKQAIGNIGLSSFSNDAGFTNNTGTVTSVISGTGSGIDVSLATTTPTLVLNLNELGAGTIASFAGVSAGGDSINQAIGNISLSSFNDDLSYAQSGDNISIFTNNAGYITGISSLTDIGDVSGTPADKHIVYYDSGGPGWVSQTLASALTDQNVSSLINDAGYTTNIGDITGVTTSGTSGLDGGVTSGTATLSLDFSRLTAGVVADLKAGTIAFITSGGNMRKVAASNLLFETDGVTGTFYDTEFQTVDGGTQTEYRQRTVTVTDGQITAFGSFGAWQSVVVA